MILTREIIEKGVYFNSYSVKEHLYLHTLLLAIARMMMIPGDHQGCVASKQFVGFSSGGGLVNSDLFGKFGKGAYLANADDVVDTFNALLGTSPARYGVMTESPYSATLTVRPSLEEAEAYSQKLAGEQNISSAVVEFRKVGGYNVTSKLVYTVERLQLAEDIGESSDV